MDEVQGERRSPKRAVNPFQFLGVRRQGAPAQAARPFRFSFAEEEGFEPPVPVKVRRFSKPFLAPFRGLGSHLSNHP